MLSPQTKTWETDWTTEGETPWRDDATSLFLAQAILQRYRSLKGRPPMSAIEVGVGSGLISRFLNQAGAETSLLDANGAQLKRAQLANEGLKRSVTYIESDIFSISPEQVGREFELVWNFGAFGRYSVEAQRKMLTQMATLLTNNGVIITLSPYGGSAFGWFRRRLSGIRAGGLGQGENLITGIGPALPAHLQLLEKERSLGLVILLFHLFGGFQKVPGLKKIARSLHNQLTRFLLFLLQWEPSREMIFFFDRVVSRLIGGYLLVSVVRAKR